MLIKTSEELSPQKTTKSKRSNINLSIIFVVTFVMLLIIPYFIDQNLENNIEAVKDISTTDYIIEVISYIISTHICYYVGCFIFILLVILLFIFGFIGNTEIISNTYNNQLTIKKLNNEIQELKKLHEQKEVEKQKMINELKDQIKKLDKTNLEERRSTNKDNQISQLTNKLNELQKKSEKDQEEIANFENQLASVSSEKSKLEGQIKELEKTNLKERGSEVKNNEILKLKNQLNELDQKYKKTVNELDKKTKEVESLLESKKTLEEAIGPKDAKINELTESYNNMIKLNKNPEKYTILPRPNDLLQEAFSSEKKVISTDSSLNGLSIIEAIEKHLGIEIKSYKLLYDQRLNEKNELIKYKENLHNYIDDQPYPTTVIKNEKRLIIAISNRAFQKDLQPDPKDKGMLISIDISNDKTFDNICIFTLSTLDKKKSLVSPKKAATLGTPISRTWDENYLIYGNSEIRIKANDNSTLLEFYSNFATDNGHYQTIIDNKKYDQNILLGYGNHRIFNGHKNNQRSQVGYQVFSLIVE